MGTTTFLTMNSLDPSWADRVELAVLLAPVAHVEHMESPIKVGAGLLQLKPKLRLNFNYCLFQN